jgi:hypothetical protein
MAKTDGWIRRILRENVGAARTASYYSLSVWLLLKRELTSDIAIGDFANETAFTVAPDIRLERRTI